MKRQAPRSSRRPRKRISLASRTGTLGDVTLQMRGNLVDGVLDVIVGRITLPADAKLEQAIIDRRFLKPAPTFRVRESVTFEKLGRLGRR